MPFLKKVNVPVHARKTAYATENIEVGLWCYPNGFWTADQIADLDPSIRNKPGYAYVGAPRMSIASTGDTGRKYPVDKLIFIPEYGDSDTRFTVIVSGAGLNYYTEGQFETDQYVDVSGTGATFGDYLKLETGTGRLCEEATATTETAESVARVIKINNAGDPTKDSLIFEML